MLTYAWKYVYQNSNTDYNIIIFEILYFLFVFLYGIWFFLNGANQLVDFLDKTSHPKQTSNLWIHVQLILFSL